MKLHATAVNSTKLKCSCYSRRASNLIYLNEPNTSHTTQALYSTSAVVIKTMCRIKHRATAIVFYDSTSVRSTLLVLSVGVRLNHHTYRSPNHAKTTAQKNCTYKWIFTSKHTAVRQISVLSNRSVGLDRCGCVWCSSTLHAVLRNLCVSVF